MDEEGVVCEDEDTDLSTSITSRSIDLANFEAGKLIKENEPAEKS
jgi:hypothetical protein